MPAGGIVRLTSPKLLIVEGRDEENFFAAALGNHLRLVDIQIMAIGGKTLLTANLNALRRDPAFAAVQSLAIIRDADVTPTGSGVAAAISAFAAVRAALAAPTVQLPCPAAHGQFAAGPPRVGVFIMSDGIADGMLETLCISSVSGEAEFACLTQFFNCCQGHDVVPNNMHKARAHAWLASRPEPDKRVGEAALAGYWPFSDSAFAPLWTFIQAI